MSEQPTYRVVVTSDFDPPRPAIERFHATYRYPAPTDGPVIQIGPVHSGLTLMLMEGTPSYAQFSVGVHYPEVVVDAYWQQEYPDGS